MFLKTKHFFTKMQDILITDIRYLVPCMLKWFYHRKIKRDIFLYKLKDLHSGHKANLYRHGEWESEERGSQSTLILHGLYSHPCLMLHLAKIAQKAKIGPIFSLYISYDEVDFDRHRSLINQAIESIEKM